MTSTVAPFFTKLPNGNYSAPDNTEYTPADAIARFESYRVRLMDGIREARGETTTCYDQYRVAAKKVDSLESDIEKVTKDLEYQKKVATTCNATYDETQNTITYVIIIYCFVLMVSIAGFSIFRLIKNKKPVNQATIPEGKLSEELLQDVE